MKETGYSRNYMRAATENAVAHENFVRSKYGYSSAGTEALLRMAAKLDEPSKPKLSAADVRLLKDLHPHTPPHEIDSMVAALHDTSKVSPSQRSDIFVSVMTQNLDAASGRVDLHNDATRHVKALRDSVAEIDVVDSILAKRAKTGKEVREPAPYVENETRQIIRGQIEPKGVRPLVAEMEREGLAGGPVTDLVRHASADKLEEAYATLEPDSDADLRSVISASVEADEIESLARDQQWIGSDV